MQKLHERALFQQKMVLLIFIQLKEHFGFFILINIFVDFFWMSTTGIIS